MNELLKQSLNGNLNEYKSIPFWSWNNNLDEKELIKQIEEMKSVGYGGFIIHARMGLQDEYLGERWFSCVSACLKKARELSMQVWIYDENGWPSGFVGGKLLEKAEYRAKFLKYSVGAYDSNAFAVFVDDKLNGYRRVDKIIDGINEYHNIYLETSPANTDILNPKVVDEFIKETHEKYYQRFSNSFGRELEGFFTDEPQYYRWATPYTSVAEQYFENDNEDIRDGLIWLFVKDERGYAFRQKYYSLLNKLYVENYYKKIYDWCEFHNCKLTGHSVEEDTLHAQMYGGAAVMPTYEYESMPAIDCLGRSCLDELSPKQIGSVASQLGKKQVLTETFACSGHDVTPTELKSIAESQYFHGITKMCQHLFPYSYSGQAKYDHPPIFSKQCNWYNNIKVFNTYFDRLGYIISNTKEITDIAILHPMRDVWLNYIRELNEESVKELEESFSKLLLELRKNGVTYHFIDESILAKYGKTTENGLNVKNCLYTTVLIPEMVNISSKTYEILKQYNGKLCVLGCLQYLDGKKGKITLSSNISLSEIIQNARVKFYCTDGKSFLTNRASELGEFLFIKNTSMTENSTVFFKNTAENYTSLNLETLEEGFVDNEITLKANQSLVLIKSNETKICKSKILEKDITDDFKITNITENYLVLDYAQHKKDGEDYGERLPINCIFERLLRVDYKGLIIVKQKFIVNDVMPITLIMEKSRYKSVMVNCKEVSFNQSSFDINFIETDISNLLKVGENELEYVIDYWQHNGVHFALFDPLATESLRNCLYYDTTLNAVYLKGDFTVNKDFSISKRTSLPKLKDLIYKNGYPFFMGEITYQGEIEYKYGQNLILSLDGRYLVAKVSANGNELDLILDNEKDIANILNVGSNLVTIKLRSSLRNLFGPHHYDTDDDMIGVAPKTFTFLGDWGDNVTKPKDYCDEYKSVYFGLRKLKIKF